MEPSVLVRSIDAEIDAYLQRGECFDSAALVASLADSYRLDERDRSDVIRYVSKVQESYPRKEWEGVDDLEGVFPLIGTTVAGGGLGWLVGYIAMGPDAPALFVSGGATLAFLIELIFKPVTRATIRAGMKADFDDARDEARKHLLACLE